MKQGLLSNMFVEQDGSYVVMSSNLTYLSHINV